MRKIKARLLSILLAILCVLGALLPAAGEAWAAVAGGNGTSETQIWQKTLVNAISTCYNSDNINSTLTSTNFRSNRTNAVFKDNPGTFIYQPGMGSMNCRQVFENLRTKFNKTPSSPTDLGFVTQGNDSDATRQYKQCAYFTYQYSKNNEWLPAISQKVCFMTIGGNIAANQGEIASSTNGPIRMSLERNENSDITYVKIVNGDNRLISSVTYTDNMGWNDFYGSFNRAIESLDSNSYRNKRILEEALSDKEDNGSSSQWNYELPKSNGNYDYATAAAQAVSFYTSGKTRDDYKFTKEDMYEAWKIALLKMSDYKSNDKSLITIEPKCAPTRGEAITNNQYAYYSTEGTWCPISYNESYYKELGSPKFNVVDTNFNALTAQSAPVVLKLITDRNAGTLTSADAQEQKKQKCNEGAANYRSKAQSLINDSHTYEELRQRAQRVLRGIDQLNGRYWKQEADGTVLCEEIVDFNNKIVPLDGETGEIDYTNPGLDDNDGSFDDDGPEGNGEVDCGSEVNGLGWILCPTLNILGNTVSDVYDGYIRSNFLEVKPEWLNTESEVYTKGWSQFRNFANILFAILLVIVILSQVTGIGITNYGIKKMLPRLIIVAILINLSFFICQLAVDISNILGVSLEQILSDMGVAVEMPTGGGAAGSTAGSIASVLSVAGIAAAGFSVGAWIVPVLLALLSSLIGVLFCAIILGLRQALIVLLVVISPLAIACYALDGTKSLFDKWRKLFVALLAVFPICGLLMGAGIFGSSLLWSVATGNFFLQLISVLLKVVPFFLIPSVLKQSFAIAGNIGAKISRISSGVRGDFTRVARKSDLYQRADATAGAAHAGASSWMGKRLKRIPGVGKVADSKFGQFLGRGGTRRRAQFIQKQYNLATSDAAANAIAAGGLLDSDRRAGIESAALEKAENQGTEEQQSLYRTKLGIDGVANESALKRELENIQKEYDRKPFDATLRRKVKALTKFMLDFDNGRGELTRIFHNQISKSPDSATTRAMDELLQRPENMGVIKQSGQRGLQAMLMDRAQKKPIKSLAQYAAAKAEKPTAHAVGNMDTSALEAQVRAIQNNSSNGEITRDSFKEWAEVYAEAMNNRNTSGNLSVEQKQLMQQVRNYVDNGTIPPLAVKHT